MFARMPLRVWCQCNRDKQESRGWHTCISPRYLLHRDKREGLDLLSFGQHFKVTTSHTLVHQTPFHAREDGVSGLPVPIPKSWSVRLTPFVRIMWSINSRVRAVTIAPQERELNILIFPPISWLWTTFDPGLSQTITIDFPSFK